MMANITGYDYEYLWALYLKCKGYGVEVTKKSGDEGVDVIAIKDYRKTAYQCKLHSKPVGRNAIAQVYIGKDNYKCSKAIVVTNNTFTKPAIETAKKRSVGLLPNKTPEVLIEACSQSYKEGKINPEDELLLHLPVAVQKAIMSGNKNDSENLKINISMKKSGEISDTPKWNNYNSDEDYSELFLEKGSSGKAKKVCPVCGREFLEHSKICPICQCELISLAKNESGQNKTSVVSCVKSEKKKNKASAVSGVKSEKEKNKKFFYCCISAAVFICVCIFFMAMYSTFEKPAHTETIPVPVSAEDLKGSNYADVIKILQDAGFKDIELIEDADLIFGLLKQEGEVGDVSINGKLNFENNEYFPKDAKIKISYHTFKPEFKSAESDTNTYQAAAETEFVGYDTLQNLFLELSYDTTMESIDNFISKNNLEFTKQKYNGTPKTITYKIAYEDDVALQRYGKTGDHVTIHVNQQDGSFLYADYFNSSTFMEALLHNYGISQFDALTPNNKYSGYYYSKTGWNDGIIIKHENGLSSQTPYHVCGSAEEALLNVMFPQGD